MPDGDRIDPKVLDEITRSVKSFGDDVKSLDGALRKDLAEIRKIAEDGHSEGNPAVVALGKKIELQLGEIETKTKSLDAKFNRPDFGGGNEPRGEAEVAWRKQAKQFHMTKMASRGQLQPDLLIKDTDIPYDEIKLWEDNFPLWMRAKDDRRVDVKALTVGSDPEGGYWVTPSVSARIISTVYETSPMRQLAAVETITTDALEIANDLGQAGYGWVGETEDRPETTLPAPGVLRIPVHEIYASPRATQKLLEDAGIDIANWIANKIADRFARVEATAFITGNGVKKPRGILGYPAASPNADGYVAPGGIEQIHSGAATLVTADGFIALQMALKEPFQNNANWLMRRASVAAVLTLKDGFGQYLWRPGLSAGFPSVLLGVPVKWAADMPAIGAGALAVAYGDFRAAYTIVDRLGITTLRDPFTAKPFVIFYTRRRVGGDVVNFDALKLQVIAA